MGCPPQPGPESLAPLGPVLKGLQRQVLVLHRPPQPLHEDSVVTAPPAVHTATDTLGVPHDGEGLAGERAAGGSVLKISGRPQWASASCSASTQKLRSRRLDTRPASTLRLAQSTMATRYIKPRAIGT